MLNSSKWYRLLFKMTVLAVYFYSSLVFSEDLGVFGQIYSISEQDFLEFIQLRLVEMKKKGEWEKVQNQFRDNVKKHADRPMPVRSLTKTSVSKSWDYDPSITVPYDLKDYQGRVFVRVGTTVNPLQYITLHKILIFFDGDDKTQVNWAAKMNKAYLGHINLILVNGSIMAMQKIFSQQIYFDQEGKLTSKFNIQHVPAEVEQNGLKLKISEVVV